MSIGREIHNLNYSLSKEVLFLIHPPEHIAHQSLVLRERKKNAFSANV